ncbi:hypothetical protein [Mitsuaria sp. GD03876]|uniref:hypothetical protein n=1 Tax=Mitsuaria sp. GD03876 TaxID=2975399 RepID=UPI002447ACEB|nr:hypothetical protein [Mitsuaria sp. GD03876]MDH0867122.1 hypothetical protein [Mitsuaria sp. GD03876]
MNTTTPMTASQSVGKKMLAAISPAPRSSSPGATGGTNRAIKADAMPAQAAKPTTDESSRRKRIRFI